MLAEFTVTRQTKADLPVKNEIRLYEERFGGIETIIAYVTEDAIAGEPHKYIWNRETCNWDLVDDKEDMKMNNENKNYDTDRTNEDLGTVKSLGSGKTKYPTQYDPTVLETFINKHPDNEYVVSFDAYEFTSLCPLTHQPDLAKVVISYIPNEKMVESKSLKLYLFSYRNHGSFHEDCVNTIMKDLVELMDPKYIEVRGIFAPRGGISIFPFATYADEDHKDLEQQRRIDILRDSSNRAIRYDM